MISNEFITMREDLGLDQSQLAELMNTRLKRIQNVETGEGKIKGPMVPLIQAYAAGYRPAEWPDRAE